MPCSVPSSGQLERCAPNPIRSDFSGVGTLPGASNVSGVMRHLLLVACVAVIATALPVQAHDHRPPRATLGLAGEVQKGWLYHGDGWSARSDEPRFCEVGFGHGFPTFRKALLHSPGQEIVVRLHKPAAPREIEVQRWPGVDDNGYATGTPTPLAWTLRPHTVQGEIRSWNIVVLPPVVDGHLYLGVGAYWADEDGCTHEPDLGSQYAAWTFHLKAR